MPVLYSGLHCSLHRGRQSVQSSVRTEACTATCTATCTASKPALEACARLSTRRPCHCTSTPPTVRPLTVPTTHDPSHALPTHSSTIHDAHALLFAALSHGPPRFRLSSTANSAEDDAGESKGDDGYDALVAAQKAGKKLSNKDRRKLKKLEASRASDAKFAALGESGGSQSFPFAVTHQTQDITDDVQWQTTKEIQISSFTASGGKKGTALFVDAALRIRHGGRYGLIGPNGKGKTTLLRLMYRRMLNIPPSLDMLMVAQEFAANDQTALEAVLSADAKRLKLIGTPFHN